MPQKSETSNTKDVVLFDTDEFVYTIDYEVRYSYGSYLKSFKIQKCKPFSTVSGKLYASGVYKEDELVCVNPDGDALLSTKTVMAYGFALEVYKIVTDLNSPYFPFDKKHQDLAKLTKQRPELIQDYREKVKSKNSFEKNLEHYKAYETQAGASEYLTQKISELEQKLSQAQDEVASLLKMHPELAFDSKRSEPQQKAWAYSHGLVAKLQTQKLSVYSNSLRPEGGLNEKEYALVLEIIRKLKL